MGIDGDTSGSREQLLAAAASSEDKYRLAYDRAPIAMVVTTEDGRILDANPTFHEWSGYARDEIIGHPITELYVDPAMRPSLVETFRATGRIVGAVVPFRRRSGEVVLGRLHTETLRLPGSSPVLFTAVEDLTAQASIEERLTANLTAYRQLFEQSRDAIFVTAADGTIVDANPAAVAMFEAGPPQRVLRNASELYADAGERASLLAALARTGYVSAAAVRFRTMTGREFIGEVTAVSRRDAAGNALGVQGTIRDVTERRRMEAQLRQSQTFEAIGRLAGGVAHDFNNLLTVVLAETAAIREQVPADSPVRASAQEIDEAAHRGAALTRQLLAVSRQQVLSPAVVDLDTIVRESERMLRRVIAEDVEIRIELDPELWTVRADPSQLHQVILNLAINARDAMPQGGTLGIAARNLRLDRPRWCVDGVVQPGEYVELDVSDTGTGMDEETIASVFEPFFTTKGGRGTGLGLPTVLGIVKQSQGGIEVRTRPGRGTHFVVYLPRGEGECATVPHPATTPAPAGVGTVLLVEDDESVRASTARILESAGYTVVQASDGESALIILDTLREPLALLVTDSVMPRMRGPALAARVVARNPGTPVVFVSGYAESEARTIEQLERSQFVQKPYGREVLLEAVRRATAGRGR